MSTGKWIGRVIVEAIIGAGALKLFFWAIALVGTALFALLAYDTDMHWYWIVLLSALTLYALTGAAKSISLIVERHRHPVTTQFGETQSQGLMTEESETARFLAQSRKDTIELQSKFDELNGRFSGKVQQLKEETIKFRDMRSQKEALDKALDEECQNHGRIKSTLESEGLAFKGQLATAHVRIEERDADLAKANERLKSLSPLKIIYSGKRTVVSGKRQRTDLFIAVRSLIPVEGVTVEIDDSRKEDPKSHHMPHRLCPENADDPYEPVSITSDTDEKLFLVLTVIDDVKKDSVTGSGPEIQVHTTGGAAEKFNSGQFYVTARADKVLPCQVRIGLQMFKSSADVSLVSRP